MGAKDAVRLDNSGRVDSHVTECFDVDTVVSHDNANLTWAA